MFSKLIDQLKKSILSSASAFLLLFSFQSPAYESEECNFPITNYVVSADGSADYTSIQHAIDSAIVNGGNATIWIKNGSYHENLILYDSINLVGASGLGDLGDVEIFGTHTPPKNGHIILRNIRWNSDHYILFSEEEGSSHIVFMDTLLNVADGYSCYLPYWNGSKGGALEFFDVNPGLLDMSNDGAIYNPYGGARVFLYSGGLGTGKLHRMIISGQMIIQAAAIECPIQFSSESVFNCDSSVISQGLNFEDDSTAEISNSRINSESNHVIIMNSSKDLLLSACVIDGIEKPIISGTGIGTLNISGCTFPHGLDLATNVIQNNIGVTKTGSLEISSEKIRIFGGSGLPTIRASKGSLYLRSDGFSSSSRMYVNIDGAYTWTPVLTEN